MATTTNEKQEDEEMALRKVLATLDVQRKAMENEADAIYSELTTPPEEGVEPMGVDTPLVDDDGYPRGDVDVYRARTLRNRFHVLQTDHKEISQKVEALLMQLAALKVRVRWLTTICLRDRSIFFYIRPSLSILQDPSKTKAEEAEREQRLAPKPKPKFDAKTGKWVVMNWDGSVAGIDGGDQVAFKDLSREVSALTDPTIGSDRGSSRNSSSLQDLVAAGDASSGDGGQRLLSMVQETTPVRPFSRVNAVAAESPAAGAGLKEEDLIVQFGNLNIDNHDHLKAIASLVPEVAGENGEIKIEVLRRPEDSETAGQSNRAVAGSEPDYNDPSKWNKVTVSLKPRPWSGRGLIGKLNVGVVIS